MLVPLENIKPQVRKLRSYSPETEPARIQLHLNENPFDVSSKIRQETLSRLEDRRWSRYPDFVQASLRQSLAQHSGWTADGIIVGNGSNELIQALLMVTVERGKTVLISEPTFSLYRQVSTILGGEVVNVPLTPDLDYDVQALARAIQSTAPTVTFICSPNNPTGCLMSQSNLVSLLKIASGLVVVDEAYFEFSGQTAVPLLEQYSNLVVLRTFSKAMAMAGLRIGYLLAAPELVRELSKSLLPYNVNVVSQTAAEVAIEMYKSEVTPLVTLIKAERDRLYVELGRIPGLRPRPSHANFMIVRSAIPPGLVYRELVKRDILIRNVSGFALLPDYFRVCVGTPEENDHLIEALGEVFKETKESCEQTL